MFKIGQWQRCGYHPFSWYPPIHHTADHLWVAERSQMRTVDRELFGVADDAPVLRDLAPKDTHLDKRSPFTQEFEALQNTLTGGCRLYIDITAITVGQIADDPVQVIGRGIQYVVSAEPLRDR